MIDIHYWPTPNGHKITMLCEEAGIDYQLVPINIGRGAQFESAFVDISPNGRIPAIVDHAPADSHGPLSMFESGAILLYLADKTARFVPGDVRGRAQCLSWLFWQMAGLGPMAGQNHHFNRYAPESIPYAKERYTRETARLYGVLDRQLQQRAFICGDAYTIADIAAYPWIVPWQRQLMILSDFPALERWFEAIAARPATQRAYALADSFDRPADPDDEARKHLFGQGAKS